MDHRDRLEELVVERTAELSQQVAERLKAQEALTRNERLATLGHIAATVSHELRNPLSAIGAALYQLDRAVTEPSPGWHRARDRIGQSMQSCIHITEEWLSYARVHDLYLRDVELDSWCREVTCDAQIPADVQVVENLDGGASVEMDSHRMILKIMRELTL